MSEIVILTLTNNSNGEYEEFYFKGNYYAGISLEEAVLNSNLELRKLLKDNSQVIECDIMGYDNDQEPSTIEEVRQFVVRRNQDAEFKLPDGLLYKDFYKIWNLIAEYVDWEAIEPSEDCIFVKDVDSVDIMYAEHTLKENGYNLEVRRHNIANGYDRYYEED